MKKVVIIGGGASGLMAAICAAQGKNQVTLIERNNSCAKKILITGNGKCNYFNRDQDIHHYHTTHLDILKQIVTETNQKRVLTFFDSIGIIPKIKNNCYYPYSNQATSIKEGLLLQAQLCHVKIKNDILVDEIIKEDSHFILNPLREKIWADKVVLAAGSKACPKTGSDGIGYTLARSLGHSITEVLPALVPLKGDANYFKSWSGIRCDVKMSLYEENEKIKEEQGEIQLTDYGISGICSFNISRMVSQGLFRNKKMSVNIDFMPWLSACSVYDQIEWINQRNIRVQGRNIEQLLEGFLHYKLIAVIVKESHISLTKHWEDFSLIEQTVLSEKLRSFPLDIVGTESFVKAQVCTGGIPLNEIQPETMESLKVKGLYLVGEMVDVDGDCGGYNLGFAWISGMLAGKATGGLE